MFDTIRQSFSEAFHEGKAASANKLSNLAPPSAEALFLRRTSFGIAPDGFYRDGNQDGDLAAFRKGGGDLAAQVNAWVDGQLNMSADKDLTDIGSLINGKYSTLGMTTAQEWSRFRRRRAPYNALPYNNDDEKNRVSEPRNLGQQEMQMLALTRGIFSRKQLFERLTMFWHDHFNINSRGFYAYVTWASWNRLIREHTLGNFYQMLLATAKHPAMLYYLDNYSNSVAGTNENYARELFELHTFGAMNYYGVVEPDQVPTYTSADGVPTEWLNQPKGYVDSDVYELARILTGWSIDDSDANGHVDTGEFKYKTNLVDDQRKYVLGWSYPASGNGAYPSESHRNATYPQSQTPAIFHGARFNQPEASETLRQGHFVLWRMATHPGTAKHIAHKLVRHFVADEPPQALIDEVAETFMANSDAPDQLKRCYQTLFKHPLMRDRSTWSQKKARPVELFIHTARVSGAQHILRQRLPGENNTSWENSPLRHEFYNSWNVINRYLPRTGHDLWRWAPPDGPPEEAGYWLGVQHFVQSIRMVDWITDLYDQWQLYATGSTGIPDAGKVFLPILTETEKAFPDESKRTPRNLVTYWAERVWGFSADASELTPFIHFLCQVYDEGTNEQEYPDWVPDQPIYTLDSYATNPETRADWNPYRWRRKLRKMVVGLFAHPYAQLR